MYQYAHFLIFFIAILTIFALSTSESFGQIPVSVNYTMFENTILMTFQNNIDTEISTIHVWLDDTSSFKSIKTEQEWSGRKNSDGIILFTSQNDGLGMNRHVKFGLIANTSNYILNWRALASNGDVIASDNVTADNADLSNSSVDPAPTTAIIGISDNSKFYLIPTDIRPGSTARIIGTQFIPNQILNFYLDDTPLGNVLSDNSGNFVGTIQLSSEQAVERVSIIIRDDFGNSKNKSIRISEPNLVNTLVELPFNITTYPETLHIGNEFTIIGTGPRGNSPSLSLTDPNGTLLGTTIAPINQEGYWMFRSLIKPDSISGTYTINVTLNGKTKSITVELVRSLEIDIHPVKSQYDSDDKNLTFTGSAPPNSTLSISLVYKNSELFYTELSIGSDGLINLQIPITPEYKKDTYILYASFENLTASTTVGIGVKPEQLIFATLDKLQYSSLEDAIITITGPPHSEVNLLILNPANKEMVSAKISLDHIGTFTYVVDLSNYTSNTYIVLVDRGNIEFSTFFTVDLRVSGKITSLTTPSTTSPGRLINLIGNVTSNTLVDLKLYGPESKLVDETLTYSYKFNKEYRITNKDLRLPLSANITDEWYIRASIGTHSITIPVEITTILSDKIVVKAVYDSALGGNVIKITGSGVNDGKNRVTVPIVISDSENTIYKTSPLSSSDGNFQTSWFIPPDSPLGEYTVTITIGDNVGSTTFTVN